MVSSFDPKSYTRQLRQNWNSVAPQYRRISEDYFRSVAHAFVDFTALKPRQSVLDVACGPGTATTEAVKAVGRAGKVVGVDLSFEMLKLAGEKLGTVDLREMSAEALDFPQGTFDAVICQLGLMLFAEPETAMKEMVRVTKPGGKVSCLVQGTPDKMLFTSLVLKTMVRHAPELKTQGGPSLYAYGPEGVLERALTQAGLARVRSGRLTGTYPFDSPEIYWEILTTGGGRTGSMLKSLPAEKRAAIRNEVLATAETYRKGRRLEIPFEFVMAQGVKT
jgi:ubiquinone/menaquinone biosynthesis C-methylase UbiE